MIGCVRKVNNLKFAPRIVSCRNYKHYNPEQFISDLKRLNFSSNMNTDVDTVWSNLKKLFLSVVDKHAPVISKIIEETFRREHG